MLYSTNELFQISKTIGNSKNINKELVALERKIQDESYFPVDYDRAARVNTYTFNKLTYNEKLGGIELGPAAFQKYWKGELYDQIIEENIPEIDYVTLLKSTINDKYKQKKLTLRQTHNLKRIVFTQGSVWTELMMDKQKLDEVMALDGSKLKIHPMMNPLNKLSYIERYGQEKIIEPEYSSHEILDLDLEGVYLTGITELNISAVIKGHKINSVHNWKQYEEETYTRRPTPGFFYLHKLFVENGDNIKDNFSIINKIFNDYRAGFYFPQFDKNWEKKFILQMKFLKERLQTFQDKGLN